MWCVTLHIGREICVRRGQRTRMNVTRALAPPTHSPRLNRHDGVAGHTLSLAHAVVLHCSAQRYKVKFVHARSVVLHCTMIVHAIRRNTTWLHVTWLHMHYLQRLQMVLSRRKVFDATEHSANEQTRALTDAHAEFHLNMCACLCIQMSMCVCEYVHVCQVFDASEHAADEQTRALTDTHAEFHLYVYEYECMSKMCVYVRVRARACVCVCVCV
jgi:hypothetical protein